MYPYQMFQPQPNQTSLVSVRSESEAMSYPIAPGNSITFKDETAPYVYTKTMGLSPLDQPKFEKYRLVKEDDGAQPVDDTNSPVDNPAIDLSKYALASDLDAYRADIDAIKADIETFRGDLYGIAGKKKNSVKKEAVTDE